MEKKKKKLPTSESIQSFRQHKPKQEHAEMHRNQTDKKFKTKKKYLKKKKKRKATNNIQGKSREVIS